MSRLGILLIFLVSTIFSISCSHSTPVKDLGEEAYFGTLKVHRYQLTNGLKVLILEDHSAPTFAYQTWFNVGSGDEEIHLTGLAHLFEHMMFKTTKNHPEGELTKILELAGAVGGEANNAFTNRDYTGYEQILSAGNLDLVASLESDRMVNLIIDDPALNKEREVVKNEKRFRTDNNPDGLMDQKIYELAYTKHSYRWPVIGYMDDLDRAKSNQCQDFYKRHYAPNNATIAIVGDVSPSKALRTINKYYGSILTSEINRHISPPEPPQTQERRKVLHLKTPVEKLELAYHIGNIRDPDYPVITVLESILADGKSSRLYHKLVDSGIATSVDIDSWGHKAPGLFIFYVNMQKGKTASQALSVINATLNDLSRKILVSPEEIKRAIAKYKFSLFNMLSSSNRKAQFIAYYETVAGNFEYGVELVNKLDQVTPEDLVRVIKKYFNKNNRSIVTGVPLK